MPGFFGAAGTGKTEQLVSKVLEGCFATGCDALFVARNYNLLRRAAHEKFRYLGAAGYKDPQHPFNENKQEIELRNGRRIWFASCDIPENLWGPEVGIVALEEACLIEEKVAEPGDCQTLKACLSRKRQRMPPGWTPQLLATGTPKGVEHWTYKVWGDPKRSAADKAAAPWWGMTIYENTTLYDHDEKGELILYALDGQGDQILDEEGFPIRDPKGRPYSQYIRDQERTFGVNSDFAKQELYGQWIVQSEGRLFHEEWFPRYDEKPEDIIAIITSWDTAATTKEYSSYTVGQVWGVTADHRYYLLDMVREKMEYGYVKDAIRQAATEYKAAWSLIENKGSGQQALQELAAEGVRIAGCNPITDKADRASQASIAAQEGRVYLPSEGYAREHGMGWLDEFEAEVFAVPYTINWDVTDAMSQFIIWAEERRHAIQKPRTLSATATYGRRRAFSYARR